MRASRRGLALVLSAVLAGASCTSSPPTSDGTAGSRAPTPTFGPSDEPLIAFHADPGGRDDTYVMDPQGGRVTAVTEGMETIAQPLWSPDGAQLIVACCTSDMGHLYLVDGPGAEPVELAAGISGAADPAWSPDGSSIAFGSTASGTLFVVDVSGPRPGDPRELGLTGAGPSWSPDGSRIAFFADRNGNLDIYTARRDGTDVVPVTDDAAPEYSPSWSPSGNLIAFVSEADGDQDMHVVRPDGSREVDVSRDAVPDDFPVWSPGGDRLAYVAYLHGADPLTIGDGDAEIFVVGSDGARRRNLSQNPAWDGDPA